MDFNRIHLCIFAFEAVPKCQILKLQPIKTVVLQAVGRKTTRACDKIINFGTDSFDTDFWEGSI